MLKGEVDRLIFMGAYLHSEFNRNYITKGTKDSKQEENYILCARLKRMETIE